ncbi:hypothetical protein RHSIM_Rhsim02G0047100 [Rhododendron simsii]|uniref:EF-hand domain-containing protein n=1 Tax=Rhododendron simsii TaxID=118357 RepID=A0A834LVD9_RHOSS|nr:hypothetical protein RHSIM_Rhsim02G0047100 [Rhododendron simsii]
MGRFFIGNLPHNTISIKSLNQREMGERRPAAAQSSNQSESGKREVQNGCTEMDMDGDGAVGSQEYSNYVSKDRYELDVVDVLDKNRDGMQEYLNERLTCHDAGTTNELCCKCYGDKTSEHLDDHTCFTDVHDLIQLRKPKLDSQSQNSRQAARAEFSFI